jgi:hypothetical protein
MNYQWPLNNIYGIEENMTVVPSTNITSGSRVNKYRDSITIYEGTDAEQIIVKNEAPATDTKNQTPTIVKGLVTVQLGNVVFNKQQAFALAGDAIKSRRLWKKSILEISGYEIKFTDLAIALTPITTTTTAASYSSTSVVLAARDGILNGTSTVSGIGIDPSAAAPTVNSGASAAGAGTVVLKCCADFRKWYNINISWRW